MTTAKALPNYVQRLGLVNGTRIFLKSLRAGPSADGALQSYFIDHYGCVVHLRPSRADHSIFFQCVVKRQYDISHFPQYRALMACYQRTLDQGETPLIIDCGGNIGLSALWFAQQFPRARIVVIEPDQENLRLLRLNVASCAERVTVVEGGVWNRPARLRISNPHAGSAAFRVEESTDLNTEGIRAYAIDELCAIGGSESPLIVKIDIEGAQATLFSTNTEWTARTALVSLELDDWLLPWAGTSRPFFRTLAAQRFDYLLGGESIYCFNADVLQP